MPTLGKPVKALAHDGQLRRQRYTHENALQLVKRGVVYARWNRERTIIRCIQFVAPDARKPEKPALHWSKGRRYSFLERCGDRLAWAHRKLPDLSLEESFAAVTISITN